MSESKYILIYPFESRERAFEVGNDIDGSLMWQNGTAYPRDNIPALIVPLSEFSGRWTAPNQAKELKQENQRLREVVDMTLSAIYANPDLHAEFAKTDYTALMELMLIAENKE